MLGRRGEKDRFEAERPAAQWRRRDRQAERDEATREFDDFEAVLGRRTLLGWGTRLTAGKVAADPNTTNRVSGESYGAA